MVMQATRQSTQLRLHGGVSVEELATKRKQKHNLDSSGTKISNSFAILNEVDDEILVQTAKDLGVHLASDDGKAQITAIKAEEMLRAILAEASYRVHLDNLKHRGVHEDDGLDLDIIDNDRRGVIEPYNSIHGSSSKTKKNQKGNKRKKK
jgi:hypothetical protein